MRKFHRVWPAALIVATLLGAISATRHSILARPLPSHMTYCGVAAGGNLCKGLLPGDFVANPKLSSVKKLEKLLHRSGEAYRTEECVTGTTSTPCPADERQFGTTSVIEDAQQVDIAGVTHLDPKVAILVGSIRFAPGAKNDWYYKVGGNVQDEDARTVYVILTGGASKTGGTRWSMYQKDNGDALKVVKSGHIVNCKHDGDGSLSSYFMTCPRAAMLTAAAKAQGTTLAAYVQTLSCLDTGDCTANVRDSAARSLRMTARSDSSQRGNRVRSTLIATLFDADYLTAPYWFTCALGCCTADTGA